MSSRTSINARHVQINGNNNVVGYQAYARTSEQVPEAQQIRAWIRKYEQAGNLEGYPEGHFAPNFRDRVMQDTVFKECLSGKSQTMVLIGKAGVGKTTAVQGIIRSLELRRRPDKLIVAAIFYSRGETVDAHHPSKVMMTLLGQVVDQVPLWTKHVRSLWQLNKPRIPSAEEIATVIGSVLNTSPRGCVFIDAVDECKDRDHVAKVLSCLQKIQKKTKLGVFITDRVAEVAVWRPSFPEASELPIKRAEDADVTWYIRDRLMCSISMRELLWENEQLLGDIVTVISQASHGIFTLVHRHVEYLISQLPKQLKATERDVRDDLKRIARVELSEVFDEGLERIFSKTNEGREKDLARRVFSFLRDAARRLTIAELEHLTAWDCATQSLPQDQARGWHEIRRICLGLVEVDDFGYVQYGHPDWYLSAGSEKARTNLPNSHAELGRICVQYLSQEKFSSGAFASSAEREGRFYENPFLPYASKYWGWHFNPQQRIECSPDDTPFADDALQFLRMNANVEFARQMARREDLLLVEWWQTIQNFARTDVTMFHEQPVARMAVGLFDKLQGAVEDSEDLDPFFPCRTTGMHWACREGLHALVLGLLQPKDESEEIAFDCKDKQQRTPLHVAATFGRTEIVEALLSRGADRDLRDKFGYSPLMSAAENGHVEVVELLLRDRDVNVNAQTTPPCSIYERSALHITASKGHIAVARALLHHPHIKVNLRDSHGNTALHLATKMGNRKMIQLFLDSDKSFDPNARVLCHSVEEAAPWCRFCGCSSLHLASLERDHTDIIQDLLVHYSELWKVVDNYQRTPLHCAARMDAEHNIEILLKHDPRQINATDKAGWPPLAEAIKARNVQVCRRLWNHPDFDKSIQSKNGTTFLQHARKCGNREIIALIKGEPLRTGCESPMEKTSDTNAILLRGDQLVSRPFASDAVHNPFPPILLDTTARRESSALASMPSPTQGSTIASPSMSASSQNFSPSSSPLDARQNSIGALTPLDLNVSSQTPVNQPATVSRPERRGTSINSPVSPVATMPQKPRKYSLPGPRSALKDNTKRDNR